MNVAPNVGGAGWAFLVLAGVLLPIATAIFALSERRYVVDRRPADADADQGPPRLALYTQTLVTHLVLFGAAISVARLEGVTLFPTVRLGLRDLGAAAMALLCVIGVAELYWRTRSSAERERLWVRRILPRTPAERRTWVLLSASAAIAEETAYRGLFVALVAGATGSVAVAILASAVAFALVHAPQGAAGIAYVFLIALLHQALILVTGTLLLAIVVHFVYDVAAGLWLAARHV